MNCSSNYATDILGVWFNLSNSIVNFFLLLTRRNLIIKTSVNSSHTRGGSLKTFPSSTRVLYHYSTGPFGLCVGNSIALSLRHLRVLRTLLVQLINNCRSLIRGFPEKVGGFSLRKESILMFIPA